MLNLIIPIYNAQEVLPNALDSLVSQTKKMFIVTIVNDADGNDYSKIIDEYSRRGLHITYIEREENGGPGAARQTGIDSNSMCDYIMFMDSDDMLTPRAIEILYHDAKANDYDIVTSHFISEQTHNSVFMKSYDNLDIWLHGKIYKYSFLKNNNIRFLPNIKLNEDVYFNTIAMSMAKKVAHICEITYIWRNNKKSLTRNKDSNFYSKGDYYLVFAVTEALKFLYTAGYLTQEIFIRNILRMYYAYMRDESKGIDYENYEILNALKEFNKEIFVNIYFKEKNTYEYIVSNLQAGIIDTEGKAYFPKFNFKEWLDLWYKEDVD